MPKSNLPATQVALQIFNRFRRLQPRAVAILKPLVIV